MTKSLAELRKAIVQGRMKDARDAAELALAEKVSPEEIISHGVTAALDIVGAKFVDGEYYLPEMMSSAQAAKSCMDTIRPVLLQSGIRPTAKAALGTVKGDLHDIGKNLVAMMLEGSGFQVIDLGADVPPERFVEVIRKEAPDLVGLSALLTTTMPMMRETVEALAIAGVRDKVKVMVGGAGVTQSYADEIGADGYAPDATRAVQKAKQLLMSEDASNFV
jgi:5-methyltetrahydrofolate--homocysteine methyltransferase